MENKRTEILQEIEAELASLKQQVLALEEKVEAFRQMPPEVETVAEAVAESDFTDLEIGVSDLPEEPAVEIVDSPAPAPVEEPVEMDIAIEDLPEPMVEEAPAPNPVPEPVVAPAPEPIPEPVKEPKPAPVVPRPETEKLPWRLDKPGISVKNIRSGISLYDRALFIGTLFKEDYALYDKTISELNGLANLDEAVDYLLERFPDWNLKSDIV